MIEKCLFLFWLSFFAIPVATAQKTHSLNAIEIKQGLHKLNTLGSVLYFAAHPDDENTRLITWLAKEKKYRTAYLSLTRGDGGQNLIGTEQAEELGLIRTQELLVARRLDGGEQFFSRANDFGFSKTAEETFRIWGRDNILADAVWVIRMFRPDIIITRFPPDERGGHGHHQASAILAEEAFYAAADPKCFPEQLAFVEPWQARRLVWNTFSFGSANTIRDDQFNILTGQYNALLGKSYGEIAAESRSSHRSQGFGTAGQRGQTNEYFETVRGGRPEKSLMDGVETSWKRVNGSASIQPLVDRLIASFEPEHPERSVDQLISLLQATEQLEDRFWRAIKAAEIKELIAACAGLWFESSAAAPAYAIGENIKINTQVILRTPGLQVQIDSICTDAGNRIRSGIRLKHDVMAEVPSVFTANKLTQPYWLAAAHSQGAYVVPEQQYRGLPENPDGPKTRVLLSINGKKMWFERPIVYKSVHPAKGEIYEPLSIIPVLTVNVSQKALVFKNREPKRVEVRVAAHKPGLQAVIKPVLPAGWRAEPVNIPLRFNDGNDETVRHFTLYPPETSTHLDSVSFTYTIDGETKAARGISRIRYDHIPAITWFPESKSRLTKVETGVSAKRVGYLPGAGDLVANSLREIGIWVDLLEEKDVMNGDLSVYDAIITGVRLYNVNERIKVLQPRLLDYVKQGGTLLVQYNVNSRLGISSIGPYPFSISRSRVTEEDAEVRFAEPGHPVLNVPNKITPADFHGWIQERGLYFAENSDNNYQMPLEMNDHGERPHRGSLLVAPYGEGKFVYTSLSFFRQLPAGIPGAYRLFINLLAKENR